VTPILSVRPAHTNRNDGTHSQPHHAGLGGARGRNTSRGRRAAEGGRGFRLHRRAFPRISDDNFRK
jgi:hypothetical protein